MATGVPSLWHPTPLPSLLPWGTHHQPWNLQQPFSRPIQKVGAAAGKAFQTNPLSYQSCELSPSPKMAPRLRPLYSFDDPAEFYRRHSGGVLKEFENESREVNAFNAKQIQFRAWALANLYRGKDKSYWVFLVRGGEAEILFPREGESCEVLLWSKGGKVQKSDKYWQAERIENPAASFGVTQENVLRMPAFKVKVPGNVPDNLIRPLQDDPDEVDPNARNPLTKPHAFGDKKAAVFTMKLRLSSATKDAEFGAIDKLFKGDEGLTSKQKTAFKYLLDFRDVPFTVNLFQHFPHLRDPLNNPGGMPPKVVTMLNGFNAHQRMAYRSVLSSLPCGIGIIPGGPGAGKTHWNLVLTAAIQSKNIIYHGPEEFSNRSAKVLYILDINKPLDDTCNKIVRLYNSLGLKKNAVRLYGWPYSRNQETIDFRNKFMFMARMNRFRRQTFNESCLAPTLDELVWDKYQQHKHGRYHALHDAVSTALKGRNNSDNGDLKELTGQLYREVLDQVDFIATTPVPAATRLSGLFQPDIVIFDESPHAREASTMIAIAQYDPIAWIFSGDHRQTRPFVASDDVRDNPWAPQLLVSMMERADRQGAIRQSLFINHRAYGGLQKLASRLFYQNNMISGHKEEDLFPPSVSHTRRFLERFLRPGQKLRDPRLLVFDGSRSECRVGTSWFNPRHIDWVMERVSELVADPMFRQVGKDEHGTILIISPYKESFIKYKKAIQSLPVSLKMRLNVQGRVEARTVDTVQGGEADFIFLDFVRSQASDFLDDPNRLNVALTRARQGEVILMQPGMRRHTQYLSQVFDHCDDMGQIVEINQQAPRPMAPAPDENERQAYERHLAQQRKSANERVAYGLEPSNGEESGGLGQTAQKSEDPLEEDNALKSIFSAKIAGLASMMERILAERKGKESSENSHPRETKQKQPAPTNGHTLVKQEHDFPQSPWSVAPSPTTAATTPNAHHGSEDMIQFSPNEKRIDLSGPQSQASKTRPPMAAPIWNGQGSSSEKHIGAPADGVNGVDQGDAAPPAPPEPSTSAYWW